MPNKVHKWFGAMMSCSDGNSPSCRAMCRRRKNCIPSKTNSTAFVFGVSDDIYSHQSWRVYPQCRWEGRVRKRLFVQTYVFDVGEASASCCSDIIRCSASNFERQFRWRHCFFERHVLYHLTSSLIRWHLLQPILFAIHSTPNPRPDHILCETKTPEVAIQLLHDRWRDVAPLVASIRIGIWCLWAGSITFFTGFLYPTLEI